MKIYLNGIAEGNTVVLIRATVLIQLYAALVRNSAIFIVWFLQLIDYTYENISQ
jgi:hypothetical protein